MNKTWIICILCLILAGLLMAWGLGGQTETEKSGARYVALIADDLGTEVLQFKQGAQAASDELGADIRFLTAREPGDEGLLQLAREAEALNPDGLILPGGAQGALGYAEEAQIPVVCLFDEGDAPSISTDWLSLGRQMGQAAKDGGATGFCAFYGGGERELLLLAGLREALPGLITARCDASEMPGLIEELPEGCAAFALNPGLTLAAAQAPHGATPLYGVDPGEARVALLRGGDAEGLALEMPYAQGYLAVMALRPGGKPQPAPARVVTRETMYDSENVKLMFPLLQ